MIDRGNWREELRGRFVPYVKWTTIDCEDGWRNLVCDLVDKLDQTGIPYRLEEIKQKLGALTVYVESEDKGSQEALDALLEEGRARSLSICERCGQSGKLRRLAWVQTLCDTCFGSKDA